MDKHVEDLLTLEQICISNLIHIIQYLWFIVKYLWFPFKYILWVGSKKVRLAYVPSEVEVLESLCSGYKGFIYWNIFILL